MSERYRGGLRLLGVHRLCVIPTAGSNDFCSERGPCGVVEGDCDANHECEDGLVCSANVGVNYGYRDVVDVCEVGP